MLQIPYALRVEGGTSEVAMNNFCHAIMNCVMACVVQPCLSCSHGNGFRGKAVRRERVCLFWDRNKERAADVATPAPTRTELRTKRDIIGNIGKRTNPAEI